MATLTSPSNPDVKVAGGDGQEVAFFGPPLAQRIALMRTFIEIESTWPAFFVKLPPNPVVNCLECMDGFD